jgi:hypothetical protein
MPASLSASEHGSDDSVPEVRRVTRAQRHVEEVLARIIARRRGSQGNSPLRHLDGEHDQRQRK